VCAVNDNNAKAIVATGGIQSAGAIKVFQEYGGRAGAGLLGADESLRQQRQSGSDYAREKASAW